MGHYPPVRRVSTPYTAIINVTGQPAISHTAVPPAPTGLPHRQCI